MGHIYFTILKQHQIYLLCRNREKKRQWLDRDDGEENGNKEAKILEKFERSHTEQSKNIDTDSDQSDNEGDSLSLTKHLPDNMEDSNIDSLVFKAENQEKLEITLSEQAKGQNTDSDKGHSDTEGDSSLSLTKHLPDDIKDDNLDSLVFEAEKIVDDAENVLENKTDSESFPSSQDDTGAKIEIGSQAKRAENGQGIDDKNHRYLRAAETIEYDHGELDPEADIEQIDDIHEENDRDSSEGTSGQEGEHDENDSEIDDGNDSEIDNENDSEIDVEEQDDYEEDTNVDENQKDEVFDDVDNQETENDGQEHVSDDNETVDKEDAQDGAGNVVDDNEDDEDISAQCWCDSLRRLDIPIPDEVTSDWLYELSLATVPEEVKSSIPGLIAELQEKIEIEDPQEEFKQLRTVKPTDACTAANLVYNREKNRFRNVLPCKFIFCKFNYEGYHM